MKRRDFFKTSIAAASSLAIASSANAAGQPRDDRKISQLNPLNKSIFRTLFQRVSIFNI